MQNENSENLKGLKVSKATHKRLKSVATDKEIGLNEYADTIISDFLNSSTPGDLKATKVPGTGVTTASEFRTDSLVSISKRNAPWVERLIELLDSENTRVITAIQQNLLAFGLIIGRSDEQPVPDADQADIGGEAAAIIAGSKRSRTRAKRTVGKHQRDRESAAEDKTGTR